MNTGPAISERAASRPGQEARQRRIQAVLFDLDDTLISWERPTTSREEFYYPRVEKIHGFLTAAGHRLPPCAEFWQITDQAISAMWAEAKHTLHITSLGRILEDIFQDLGIDTGQVDSDELLRLLDWSPRPGVELFPETLPLLLSLRQQGYRTGLLTNAFVPMWMRDEELRAYGLLDLLDERVSAADVGYLKPHPSVYQQLLRQLDVRPDQAIFVGDRPANDIAGANAVGLLSVLVSPPYLQRDLAGVQPDYYIQRLDELLPILDDLQR